MATRGKKAIIDALNEARSFELGAIIQYMGHHYEVKGPESPPVKDLLKQIALDEMRHAEALAERISYLGGTPTQAVKKTKRGGSLEKILKDDLAAEDEAIKRYKKYIKLCEKHGDYTTRRLFEDILIDEERHSDQWESLLG